jgi:FtsH-binding integral membrane protein
MLGWTVLLLWAGRRPLERRFVAAVTALVILGLILTELVAVATGALGVRRMVPTWCLQILLFVLFAGAYHMASNRCQAP